jgi:hypothetical protein
MIIIKVPDFTSDTSYSYQYGLISRIPCGLIRRRGEMVMISNLYKTMKGRIVFYSTMAITLAVAVTLFTCLSMLKKDLLRHTQDTRMKIFQAILAGKGSEFKVIDGKLMVGQYELSGNHEVVDEVKRRVGGTATVFMGDTRVSTNSHQGKRRQGDRDEAGGRGRLRHRARERGILRREGDILGVPYFTKYEPIRDSAGTRSASCTSGRRRAISTRHTAASGTSPPRWRS